MTTVCDALRDNCRPIWDELHSHPFVAEMAARLAEGGAQALRTTKHWLNELDGSMESEPNKGADLSADILAGDEAQARLRETYG